MKLMKIDIKDSDPYSAVIDAIREMTKTDGLEYIADKIVNIKASGFESNEYLLACSGGEYIWTRDWYEGGEVELIGFINVEDIEVPRNVP